VTLDAAISAVNYSFRKLRKSLDQQDAVEISQRRRGKARKKARRCAPLNLLEIAYLICTAGMKRAKRKALTIVEMNCYRRTYAERQYMNMKAQDAMFEPDLLRTFVMVAECGGFSRAAERLNSTQSTVSHQIKRLEAQAARTFLNRTTRSISLTEDGEILIDYARKFLRLADDAKQHFNSPRLEGHVRLAASDDFATYSLPEILGRFKRVHPEVRLTVDVGLSGNLVSRLDEGEFDLVLGKRSLDETEGEFVSREKLIWVAAHDFTLDPRQPLPLAVYPKPCLYRSTAIDVLNAAGLPWSVVYTSPSLSGIRAAAIAGIAITPLAENFVTPDLVSVDSDDYLPELPSIEFALFRTKGVETPAARELADLLLRARPLGVFPWHHKPSAVGATSSVSR